MNAPILVFNWKSNPESISDALALAGAVERALARSRGVRAVIAPPHPFLHEVGKRLKRAFLGAQDSFWGKGPYTGEVSPDQLKAMSVRYCILGHSERRIYQGETDEIIKKKVAAVAGRGITPILCVGERERHGRDIPAIVGDQIRTAIGKLPPGAVSKILIAYEPVWAISTMVGARPDDPESAFRAKMYIRRVLSDMVGRKKAERVPVLYGGSVSPANIKGFLQDGEMDGALVGGAGLDRQKLTRIIRIAASR